MNICIDIRALGKRRTGVENTLLNLLYYLPRLSGRHKVYLLHTRDTGFEFPFACEVERVCVPSASAPRLYLFDIPEVLRKIGADVYYTIWTAFPPFVPSRKIVTVHDLAWCHYPETYPLSERLKYQAWHGIASRYADRIIADSESTARDLCSLYPSCQERIRVVRTGLRPDYIGIRESTSRLPPSVEDFLKGDEYIVSVGALHPRKNVRNLIQGFLLYKQKVPDNVKLVIAGMGGERELGALLAQSPFGRSIHFAGYVGEEELKALYRRARFFIFPSLYEGFGLPLLEAMACGIAVAASESSSLPEVAGDAACYFHPEDPRDIAEAIDRLSHDEPFRKELVRRGDVRLAQFRAEDAASELFALLSGNS